MAYYGACGVDSAAVVVSGFEPGVVVAALELETGFEDFRGDVEKGGGEVGDEAWVMLAGWLSILEVSVLTSCQVSYLRRYSRVYHMTFAPLVCAEEDQCAWKRSQHGRCDSTVQS